MSIEKCSRRSERFREVVLPESLTQFVLNVKSEMRTRRSYIKGKQSLLFSYPAQICKDHKEKIILLLTDQEKFCWVDFGYDDNGDTLVQVTKNGRKQYRKR